jgi:CheY-like chemotaxis protein
MSSVPKQGSQYKKTVLIVEDEPDDLRFAEGVIRTACPEFCTRGVRSGEETIAYLIGENPFSNRAEFPYPILILLDLKLSGMHGFDVLRWLRKNPPHNSLPVVVLTVSGEPHVVQYSYYLGARSFLTKPITAIEFKATIAELQDWCKLMPTFAK